MRRDSEISLHSESLRPAGELNSRISVKVYLDKTELCVEL